MSRIVAWLAVLVGLARVCDAQTFVNLINNGNFEDGVPAANTPGGVQPEVSNWFIAPNGFEDLYPGVDASTGNQSAGFDTTGTLANQFNPSTWADWRSPGFAVTSGEVLRWKFSYFIDPVRTVDPQAPEDSGEIRAEMRAWRSIDSSGVVSGFSNTGTQIILLNTAGAINVSDGSTSIATPRGGSPGWIDVVLDVTVPAESDIAGVPVAAYDLRFNQIFSLITSPFEGIFQLDDVQVLREVPLVDGDYNSNLIVDAADYTVWRDNLNTIGAPGTVLGDGDDGTGTGTPDGVVNNSDYVFWKNRFGATTPLPSAAVSAASAVPEPSTGLLVASALTSLLALRRLDRRD